MKRLFAVLALAACIVLPNLGTTPALSSQPDQTPIVDAIPTYNGGVWILYQDGGVGAFHGAHPLGSYIDHPEWQNVPRQFIAISPTLDKGFVEIASTGERYTINPPDWCWTHIGHIQAGGSADIPAGCQVKGDVSIGGFAFHDSDPSTCQVTVMDQSGHITAPFASGADVSSRPPESLAADGCGKGITVLIKRWPSDKGDFPQ